MDCTEAQAKYIYDIARNQCELYGWEAVYGCLMENIYRFADFVEVGNDSNYSYIL